MIIPFDKNFNNDDFIDFDSAPKIKKDNKYIVVEHQANGNDSVLGAYDDEFSSLKVYRSITNKKKSLLYGTVIYLNLFDTPVLYDYENTKKIL